MLLELVESSNYIGFDPSHFYLLPTRESDATRLHSAGRDLVRHVRARAGDGSRATWSFAHDHSPPKDFAFPFFYFFNSTKERTAQIDKIKQFDEDCDKRPNVKDAKINISA